MDGAILILVGCILSLICVGVLGIVAFYGIRLFGGAATNIIRDVVDTGDDNEVPVRKRAPYRRIQRPEQVSNQASDDFESQVMKRLNNNNVLPPQGLSGHHGSALDAADNEDDIFGPAKDLRSQRTRRRDHDDEPIYDDWDGGDFDLFDG